MAGKQIIFQNEEKEKRAAELVIANKDLLFQKQEKEKRAAELIIADKELIFQNIEKAKRAAELVIANKELAFQNIEKEKRAAEIRIAYKELDFQTAEIENQALELIIANKKLVFQNQEIEKRAAELIVASQEKEKRAAELIIANEELAYQNQEKENRAEELKALNKQLKDKEQQLRNQINAIDKSNASIEFDLEGIILTANEHFLNLMGYKEQDIVGKHHRIFVDKAYAGTEVYNKFWERLKKGEYQKNEFECIDKKGESVWLLGSYNPILDASGKPAKILKIATDVTLVKKQMLQLAEQAAELLIANDELKKAKFHIVELNIGLEQKVVERTAQLESANMELESFSYSVSHDLRSPLRAINGFTQVLAEDYGDKFDEEGNDLLNDIIDNSKKMGQLIDNLLEFSHIGKQIVCMAPVDMGEMIVSIIAELKQQEPHRKIKVDLKPLDNIKGDKNLLRQVFINLISNAFKYTGKIEKAIVEIGSYQDNTHCTFYIKDNGAGFDMLYYDKLFGVFQRLHSSNEFEGTGVGLAIIQRIVHKHGGRVWAEAKVDEGACFYVSLPNA